MWVLRRPIPFIVLLLAYFIHSNWYAFNNSGVCQHLFEWVLTPRKWGHTQERKRVVFLRREGKENTASFMFHCNFKWPYIAKLHKSILEYHNNLQLSYSEFHTWRYFLTSMPNQRHWFSFISSLIFSPYFLTHWWLPITPLSRFVILHPCGLLPSPLCLSSSRAHLLWTQCRWWS